VERKHGLESIPEDSNSEGRRTLSGVSSFYEDPNEVGKKEVDDGVAVSLWTKENQNKYLCEDYS